MANNKDMTLELSYLNPESIRWMHRRTRYNVTSTAHIQQTVALDLLSLFESLDLDGSGQISIVDFKEAVKYVSESSDLSFDPVSLSKFFESMDADMSGTIDMNEFVSGMITHPDSEEIIKTIQSLQTVFASFANQLRRQKLYRHMASIETQSSPLKTMKSTYKLTSPLPATGSRSNLTINTSSKDSGHHASSSPHHNHNNNHDKNYETNKLRDFYNIFSVEHFKDKAEYITTDTADSVDLKYHKSIFTEEHLRKKKLERERAREAASYFGGKPKVSYHRVPTKEDLKPKPRLHEWFVGDENYEEIAMQEEAAAAEKLRLEKEKASKTGEWVRDSRFANGNMLRQHSLTTLAAVSSGAPHPLHSASAVALHTHTEDTASLPSITAPQKGVNATPKAQGTTPIITAQRISPTAASTSHNEHIRPGPKGAVISATPIHQRYSSPGKTTSIRSIPSSTPKNSSLLLSINTKTTPKSASGGVNQLHSPNKVKLTPTNHIATTTPKQQHSTVPSPTLLSPLARTSMRQHNMEPISER